MGSIEYITTRDLTDSEGRAAGKVKIVKMDSENVASVVLKCPECGAEENSKESWSEPFVNGEGKSQSFAIKCGKCSYKAKVMKLRKEIKKK